jgi:hypothetical protein
MLELELKLERLMPRPETGHDPCPMPLGLGLTNLNLNHSPTPSHFDVLSLCNMFTPLDTALYFDAAFSLLLSSTNMSVDQPLQVDPQAFSAPSHISLDMEECVLVKLLRLFGAFQR